MFDFVIGLLLVKEDDCAILSGLGETGGKRTSRARDAASATQAERCALHHHACPIFVRQKLAVVGGITVPSTNRLWSPFWSPSISLENGITYDILFTMQSRLKYHKT